AQSSPAVTSVQCAQRPAATGKGGVHRLPLPLQPLAEMTLNEMHRSHVEAAERRGMHQLRRYQQPELPGAPAKQQPAQRRQHKAADKQLPEVATSQKPTHDQKQQDLRYHTQCPHGADQPATVAQRLEMKSEKGVIGSV